MGGTPSQAKQEEDEQLAALLSNQYGDDPELAYALKMSMEEQQKSSMQVPPEPSDSTSPEDITNINLRLPDGNRLQRKFLLTNKVEDVINFVKLSLNDISGNYGLLTCGFPKK